MKKILVVDDQSSIRRIYTDLLAAEGYEVRCVSSADDANETLKKEPMDLVLLDLRMHEVDGGVLYDVMQMFHRQVKVIVSSVYHLDKQKRMVAGAQDYYDKSQGVDVLLAKVKKALGECLEANPDVHMCWNCFCVERQGSHSRMMG